MRKSTLIISIAMTGVVLALLFALVSAYQTIVNKDVAGDDTQSQEQAQQQLDQSTLGMTDTPLAAASIQIYDAPPIAAKVLGHDDVYITEYAQLNGADVYLVTFLSGDLVYVSLDGKVVSASKQASTTPVQPASHR
jgi:hypothetical protein